MHKTIKVDSLTNLVQLSTIAEINPKTGLKDIYEAYLQPILKKFNTSINLTNKGDSTVIHFIEKNIKDNKLIEQIKNEIMGNLDIKHIKLSYYDILAELKKKIEADANAE